MDPATLFAFGAAKLPMRLADERLLEVGVFFAPCGKDTVSTDVLCCAALVAIVNDCVVILLAFLAEESLTIIVAAVEDGRSVWVH